ncbi:MAG: CCA tRNA nucleotidyltransferase, partial [Spirochaetota bacterium]
MSDFYFDVPPSLYRIIQRLQGAGYRIVIVGGAVRDCLRKAKYSDYDLASNASPRQIQKLFRRCLPTGIKHGTVTILEGNDSYEITSFRNDGAYKDGRHPESVTFTGDLPGDLARRDFTINALAFEPIKQVEPSSETKGSPKQFYGHLHDLYGGQNHLQEGVICAIGPPDLRFEEDALRMLRACRFSAQLGFRIEEKTLLAIRRQHSNLKKVSRPRILQELRKLFCALYAKQGLDYLWQSQLWQTVFEGLPACDSAAFREPWGGTSWGGTFGGRTFGGALDLFDRLCRLRRTEDNWG